MKKPQTAATPDVTQAITYTPKQAMAAINCGKTQLYFLLQAGAFDSFLVGKQRLITVESIQTWARNMAAQHRIDKETNNGIY